MKILHVIATLAPRYGGPSKACLDMAAALAARGHEVHVFTTDQDGLGRLDVPTDAPIVRRGVRIRYFASGIRRAWPLSFPLCRALQREISGYDVVHIHSLYLSHGAVAGHYCRKHGVPYIIRPHGTLDPFLRKRHRLRKGLYELVIERRNMERAAAVHFTAEEERRLAAPYIGKSRSFVAPLGIYPQDYAALPARGTFRRRYPAIGTKKMVLHLGRIHYKKGLDILVDAFSLVAARRNDVHLVIAGPDDDRYGDKIRRRIQRHGLAALVTFTGMLQGEAKLEALADADVFALPSYTENFGISVVEAMACALPVVISRNVNIWREIDAAHAGLVIGCNAAECEGALNSIVSDDAVSANLGASAKRLAATHFGWENAARELERLYADAAGAATASTIHEAAE